MTKQKQNQLTKADYVLFIVGLIALTFVGAFIANSLFQGRIELLALEVIVYIAIVATYVQAIRASRIKALAQFARVISYAGIATAILIASFIAYFVATFRW